MRDRRLMDEILEETLDLTDIPPLPVDSGWRCLLRTECELTADIGRDALASGSGVSIWLSFGDTASILLTELPSQSFTDGKVRPEIE